MKTDKLEAHSLIKGMLVLVERIVKKSEWHLVGVTFTFTFRALQLTIVNFSR